MASQPTNEANGNVEAPDTNAKKTSRFRAVLPQVLASTAKNLLLWDLGMAIAFPTIVIPALLDGKDARGLVFTPSEASWFGSILFICQPLGSILSGIVLEPLGRRISMMVVNIPFILAWLLLLTASSKLVMYISVGLLGFGIGFMEAPIITYIGEIAESSLRGTLTSYSSLFATFGISFIYLMGSLADWRTVAGISVAVPIITIIAISQVPETPIWLLSRGRREDAEKALCWLRGWVQPEEVAAEFKELCAYSEMTKLKKAKPEDGSSCYINTVCLEVEGREKPNLPTANEEDKIIDKFTFKEKVKDFLRPEMRRPLYLILGFFFFSNATGMTASRPYMVKIIKEFNFPVEAYSTNVVFGVIGFIGSVLCMVTIAKFGRRPISLGSLGVCSVAAFFIGLGDKLTPWIVFILFVILVFSSYYGASGIVWTLVSEIFPFRGRSLASGLSAAFNYIVIFAFTKSFLFLETNLGLFGVFFLFSALSALGVVFLYFYLPETEGRSLQDIEVSYMKSTQESKM